MNNVLTRRKNWRENYVDLSKYFGLPPVQSGLALTPTRVKELTSKGIAVTTANAEGVYDASTKPSDYSVDPIYERDTDRNILWERSQLARQKILSKKDKLTLSERQKLSNSED
ncbi:hypothetical protein [Sigmofec virus UA08Rod_4138]|uniref:Uncharacterized protein n=1 Tax=Sigmofec virus UA08Rod_4138 TaxID=2929396 RepID=A0A976N269_9VIRU|nr:hypothetical protein [Sigmofec virus UA08Rod_4138]